MPTGRSLAYRAGRRRFGFACGSCGMLCDAPDEAEACRRLLEKTLVAGRFVADPGAPYGLDAYTLRTAATGARLGTEATERAQLEALRAPHGEPAASARLAPLEVVGAPIVSLGILCRREDLDAVLASLPVHAAWTDEIVVIVDADDVPVRAAGSARIVARPLSGDFAEQRNALQRLGGKPWMLQLDADESLDAATASLLPALAGMANRHGVVSIGLPRRNVVDGMASDVFPDTQYRLNRREVRYAGRVHERPERPWQRSFIALHGSIDHHLGRAHVISRSRRYEAMEPGHGRLEEADALLRPYSD